MPTTGLIKVLYLQDVEFTAKRYALRKFMGGLHAAYLHPAL